MAFPVAVHFSVKAPPFDGSGKVSPFPVPPPSPVSCHEYVGVVYPSEEHVNVVPAGTWPPEGTFGIIVTAVGQSTDNRKCSFGGKADVATQ